MYFVYLSQYLAEFVMMLGRSNSGLLDRMRMTHYLDGMTADHRLSAMLLTAPFISEGMTATHSHSQGLREEITSDRPSSRSP